MSQKIHTAADDPFATTEAKGDELFGEILGAIPRETESWQPLLAKLSELKRTANGAISQLPRYREDISIPLQARVAAFDETFSANVARVESLSNDAQTIASVLASEWHAASAPKVDPQREGFAREDVGSLVDAAGPDALKTIVDLVKGPHRDRAAVAMSDFMDARLARLLPDKTSRERFREGLRAIALEGAIKHGTPTEKVAATALRDLLPKIHGYIATQVVPAKRRLRDTAVLRP
jgi:hypothetical protein